jgi:hypothetical protein
MNIPDALMTAVASVLEAEEALAASGRARQDRAQALAMVRDVLVRWRGGAVSEGAAVVDVRAAEALLKRPPSQPTL